LPENHDRFPVRAEKIRLAFITEYINADGTLKIKETETAFAIAPVFGLLPDGLAPKLLQALMSRIEANENHLDPGFVGTYQLPLALSKCSANDTAYSLLLQDTYPSWLYEVNMGATTIWERWNGVLPNRQLNPTEMNSLNHCAYGSIANWMYRYMCGLNPIEETPGYRRGLIAPKPDPRITKVTMIRQTAAGRYEIELGKREERQL
jgi:alpha-L-rhamnosidase